jgi:hypothetical protein
MVVRDFFDNFYCRLFAIFYDIYCSLFAIHVMLFIVEWLDIRVRVAQYLAFCLVL